MLHHIPLCIVYCTSPHSGNCYSSLADLIIRQIMSSSSSSEDEDLRKFASCAVSADQIEKTVAEEAQKRALKASRRSLSTPGLAAKPATAATAANAGTAQGGDAAEAESTGLDLISVRIASALDAILARELDVADPAADSPTAVNKKPKKGAKAKSSSKTTTHTAAVDPDAAGEPHQHTPSTDTAAGDVPPSAEAYDDGAGVQLFKAVPKGAPCIIQPDSMQTWEPLSLGNAQQQLAAGGSFGSGSLPRTQPMRDQIPRLSLAERSRQGNKRKHQEVLEALSVDGKALQAAAVAAGYTSSSSVHTAAAGKKGSSSSKGSSSIAGACSSTVAWVKGWKRLKGQKVEGVVKDAKQWVPYEVRAAKLLGTAPVC